MHFHTNRGSEFKNYLLNDLLKEFHIRRFLAIKEVPMIIAVAEAQFKIIKTEFVRSRRFENLDNYSSENLYRKVLPIQFRPLAV